MSIILLILVVILVVSNIYLVISKEKERQKEYDNSPKYPRCIGIIHRGITRNPILPTTRPDGSPLIEGDFIMVEIEDKEEFIVEDYKGEQFSVKSKDDIFIFFDGRFIEIKMEDL